MRLGHPWVRGKMVDQTMADSLVVWVRFWISSSVAPWDRADVTFARACHILPLCRQRKGFLADKVLLLCSVTQLKRDVLLTDACRSLGCLPAVVIISHFVPSDLLTVVLGWPWWNRPVWAEHWLTANRLSTRSETLKQAALRLNVHKLQGALNAQTWIWC